jgi:hypothetical protein
VVCEYNPMACQQMIIQLYKGVIKVYTNQTNVFENSTAVFEHKDKDQTTGLEISVSIIMCGHQAYKAHIKRKFLRDSLQTMGEI